MTIPSDGVSKIHMCVGPFVTWMCLCEYVKNELVSMIYFSWCQFIHSCYVIVMCRILLLAGWRRSHHCISNVFSFGRCSFINGAKWLWLHRIHAIRKIPMNAERKRPTKSTYGLISPLKTIASTRSSPELHNAALNPHTDTDTNTAKTTSEELYCRQYLRIQSFRMFFLFFQRFFSLRNVLLLSLQPEFFLSILR